MLDLIWLVPALPLAGFLILVAFGSRLGEPRAGWVATTFTSASFVVTAAVWLSLLGRDAENRVFEKILFDWLPAGNLRVEAGFLVDPLAITMALFVTFVSSLIHLYSVGYMHGDPKFSKFFVYLNLFVFSMLMLVLGNNLVLTFLGWEGVGACSYLLISFWHTRESAARAGKKAFITNRVGDWGFMVATFLIFTTLGTVTYTEIGARAGGLAGGTATAVSLLLLVAAAGKSAQLPLYVWLPDAMEGPTPVSALIHAATMVTAGVYLLSRMSPVLVHSDISLKIIAVVGTATALFAALAATAQHDIKKVLAYSTVSQLGYMFLAVGSGAYVAALFHMITHAFFKALLFLGAGSVIHAMNDEQDMRYMGALRKVMPITGATFIVGWLAIAGVPPFAGFWSKDDILLAAWNMDGGGGLGRILWAVGLITALLTAYYMSRQVFMVFYGEAHWNEARPAPVTDSGDADLTEFEGPPEVVAAEAHAEVHPHESPWTMWVPLVVLAVGAALGGLLNLPVVGDWLFLERFLEPVFAGTMHHLTATTGTKVVLAAMATTGALIGIWFAAYVWLWKRVDGRRLEPRLAEDAFEVDAAYAWFFGGPGRATAQLAADADRVVVDGAVNGVAEGTRRLGFLLRPAQSGLVRQYAIGIALGAVGLLTWFLIGAAV